MSATAAIVGSVVGGLARRREAKQANQQAESQYNQNIALQKEFAQNGIRWKVADAKAAGLSPLAALGASTATYSPVSSTFSSSGLGDTYERMGQDVSQAMFAQQSKAERAEESAKLQAYNDAQLRLQTENAALQNDLVRQQINSYKLRNLSQLDHAIGLPSNVFRGPSRVRGRGEIDGQGDSVFPDFKGWENKVVEVPFNKGGTQVGTQPAWINTSEGPILDTNLFEDQPTPLVYYLYAKKYGQMLGEAINKRMPSNKSVFPRSGKW